MRSLPKFDLDSVLEIRTYAAACLHAHLVATRRSAPDPILTAALAEGAKLRANLLKSAELLAHFGVFDAEHVAEIRSGMGHVDMANDLVQLAELYRKQWGAVKGLSPVKRQMVDRAAMLGLELHARLGARRLADDPLANDGGPQMARSRAFTLLVRVYDQCRRAVTYLRWNEGDADSIAPSLYGRRRRRAAMDEVPDEPSGSEPSDVSPTAPESSTPPPPVVVPDSPEADAPIF
jgi:hypothetical protein